MRIKLISPKMSLRPMDSEYKRLLAPSLALLTIAALTNHQHHVYIEDENIEKLDLEDRTAGIDAFGREICSSDCLWY